MTPLIDTMRQIARDLVAKRLWPIALALLAAVVIVPVLIGLSAPEASVPGPVASGVAATPPPTSPASADGDDDGADRPRSGKVRDPFYDPPAPPAAEPGTSASAGPTSAVSAPPAAAAKAAAGEQKGAPAATPKAQAPPAAATAPKPAANAEEQRGTYYRAVMRWGSSADAQPRAVARLTPLGGRRNPAALYLGIADTHARYAVFVLGPNASSRGEGVCRTGTGCRMVALRAGEQRTFVVRSPEGGTPRRFVLRVSTLKRVTTSADAARRARAKVHEHGRPTLRAMWRMPDEAAVLRRASYHLATGLLRDSARVPAIEKAAK